MPELTIAAAILAGLVSFLSPCVLPVVPAYLGQLGAISVAGVAAGSAGAGAGADASSGGAPTGADTGAAVGTRARLPGRHARRWQVLPHALAFVAGFGAVFTLLGASATYAGAFLAPQLPLLRQLGGAVLIVLGLNLAGLLPLSLLARSWRPLDSRARRNPLGPFGLGAIFALGWTPCIGPTLGAIFGLAAMGQSAQSGILFAAYSLGLGLPFIALALALDEAPRLIRPLRARAHEVELAGGGLVMLVGVSLIFNWLPWFAARFSFITPRV